MNTHKLTKEDVWGIPGQTHGIIIARGVSRFDDTYPTICPIWHDAMPYKSVTVSCTSDKIEEVLFWLEYVMGTNCIVRYDDSVPNTIYLRAEYQCW